MQREGKFEANPQKKRRRPVLCAYPKSYGSRGGLIPMEPPDTTPDAVRVNFSAALRISSFAFARNRKAV